MKYNRICLIFILLLVLLGSNSCNIVFRHGVDEGVIEYDITFLDNEKDNPLIALLPTTMTLYFKEDMTTTRIEGFMGLFSFAYITDIENNANFTILRILDKNYVCKQKNGNLAYGYSEMQELAIEKTRVRKKILKFNCEKALVTITNGSGSSFNIYYTDEIDIEDPNTNNPFHDINGVLLEFQVKMHRINMKFRATNFIEKEIAMESFTLPDNYKSVSKKEMHEIMQSFYPSK